MHIRSFDVSLNDGVDNDVIDRKFQLLQDTYGRSTDSISLITLPEGQDGQVHVTATVRLANYTMVSQAITLFNHVGTITGFEIEEAESEELIEA